MLPEQLTGISGATAPQRCELFLNYFIVRLTGCRSLLPVTVSNLNLKS
jgi:hypothetical protein